MHYTIDGIQLITNKNFNKAFWKEMTNVGSFEELNVKLHKYESEFKILYNRDTSNLRRQEVLWPVHELNQRKTKELTEKADKETLSYLLRNHLVDTELYKLWKQKEYGRLCCTQCVEPRNHTNNTVCICRTKSANFQKCSNCGCAGCV